MAVRRRLPREVREPRDWKAVKLDSASTYSLHCSSFLGLLFRILNIELNWLKQKKELQMETIGRVFWVFGGLEVLGFWDSGLVQGISICFCFSFFMWLL